MARPGVLPRIAVIVALLVGVVPVSSAAVQPPAPPPPPAPESPVPSPRSDTPARPEAAPAQTTPSGSASDSATPPLPVDPERVRRALERPSTLVLPEQAPLVVDGLTFRVNVTQKPIDIWQYWGPKDTLVGSNVRTQYFSNWHHDYLRMVTPDAGRRAALFPSGMVPIMPAVSALTNAIEDALRRRAQRKAKEEVQQALEDFFAAHPESRVAAPSAPKPLP